MRSLRPSFLVVVLLAACQSSPPPERPRTQPVLPEVPGAISLRADGNGGRVATWSAPRDAGGVPILEYRVKSTPAWIDLRTDQTSVALPPVAVTGSYVLTVQAINSVGEGPVRWSEPFWLEVRSDLWGVQGLRASIHLGRVDLQWDYPLHPPPGLEYRVEVPEFGRDFVVDGDQAQLEGLEVPFAQVSHALVTPRWAGGAGLPAQVLLYSPVSGGVVNAAALDRSIRVDRLGHHDWPERWWAIRVEPADLATPPFVVATSPGADSVVIGGLENGKAYRVRRQGFEPSRDSYPSDWSSWLIPNAGPPLPVLISEVRATGNSGCIELSFVLADPLSREVDLMVTIPSVGRVRHVASPLHAGPENLRTTPQGVPYRFAWDSPSDVGGGVREVEIWLQSGPGTAYSHRMTVNNVGADLPSCPKVGGPADLGAGVDLLLAADLNADGKPDLVGAALGGTELRVLAGSGRLRFQPVMVTSSAPVSAILVMNVDQDRGEEVLVASSAQAFLQRYELGETGLESTQLSLTAPASLLATLDETSGPGLLVATVAGEVLVFGPGLTLRATLPVGGEVRAMVGADLDVDGRGDVLVARVGSQSLLTYFGAPGGGFVPGPVLPLPLAEPSQMVLRDWDQNGTPDLFIADHQASQLAQVSNLGLKRFGAPALIELPQPVTTWMGPKVATSQALPRYFSQAGSGFYRFTTDDNGLLLARSTPERVVAASSTAAAVAGFFWEGASVTKDPAAIANGLDGVIGFVSF